MAFLLLFASVYVILQVSSEDAKYPRLVKQILLWISWVVFVISLLIFLVLLFLALLPVMLQYKIVTPFQDFDLSNLISYGLTIVLTLLAISIYTFVWNKIERFFPKSRTQKVIEEAKQLEKEKLEASRKMILLQETLIEDVRDFDKHQQAIIKASDAFEKAGGLFIKAYNKFEKLEQKTMSNQRKKRK